MRRLASILAMFPALAFAQIPLTTADDWQSIVQTAAPSSWFAFAAGTYTTTGTALTVTSGWTRIQGAGPGQSYLTQGHATNWGVVQLTGPEIVMDGFTIYGGSTSNFGGGVLGTGGQTVTNCHVVSNSAKAGGGTYLVNVADSVVANNSTYFYVGTGQSGGGIVLATSNVASGCVISNNSAVWYAGITGFTKDQSATAVDCDIVDNNGNSIGGAMWLTATNCRIWRNFGTNGAPYAGGGGGCRIKAINCSVISNVSGGDGGGLQSSFALDTIISHNYSSKNGGGVYDSYGTNLVIRDNSANGVKGRGGGIYGGIVESSDIRRNVAANYGGGANGATLRYCTIISNRGTGLSGQGGGGISSGAIADSCLFIDNYSGGGGEDCFNSTVRNCTILNTNVAAPVVQYTPSPHVPVANTLIVHATATNIIDDNSAVWTNVAANYFTNSADGLFLPDDPPYRLPPDSPLIDAGNGDFSLFPLDLYGRDRTYLGGDPDIGATEWTDTDLPISDDGAKKKRRFLALLFGKD